MAAAAARTHISGMPSLIGRFRVKRISGLLPPFGVTKVIDGRAGCTYLFGVAVGRFRVVGRRFIYRRWPIVDELDRRGNDGSGSLTGRGRLFGFITFCHFRLEPMRPRAPFAGA